MTAILPRVPTGDEPPRGRRRAGAPQQSPSVEQPGSGQSGTATATVVGEGRAARRRAQQEQSRAGRRRATTGARAVSPDAGRAARRRALRQESRGSRIATAAARGVGELAMTVGVVLVLFVVYTTWWTNIVGRAEAREKAQALQQQWANTAPGQQVDPRNPGTFSAGEGFALMDIPKIGLSNIPILQGTDKEKILNKGVIGHYTDPGTSMPWDNQGNFGVAAHRNTHGEPFRWLNHVGKGDVVVVETATTYFTYTVRGVLPETSPNNVSVLDPIPKGGPFSTPGRYITLTTCTPDHHSTYRLIVWGELTDERPRSQGKPDALMNGK